MIVAIEATPNAEHPRTAQKVIGVDAPPKHATVATPPAIPATHPNTVPPTA